MARKNQQEEIPDSLSREDGMMRGATVVITTVAALAAIPIVGFAPLAVVLTGFLGGPALVGAAQGFGSAIAGSKKKPSRKKYQRRNKN